MTEKDSKESALQITTVRLHPEVVRLLGKAAEQDEVKPAEILRRAAGQYIAARALNDPEFAEELKMSRERIWVGTVREAMQETRGLETGVTFKEILIAATDLDLNPERTAGLLGIEVPPPAPEQGTQ